MYRILNKENGGHGSAINEGVKIIKGSYFKVVDADDWVNTDVLKETICYLKIMKINMRISQMQC